MIEYRYKKPDIEDDRSVEREIVENTIVENAIVEGAIVEAERDLALFTSHEHTLSGTRSIGKGYCAVQNKHSRCGLVEF